MPRARRSLAVLLWLAGVAVFLLGARREDARTRPTALGVAPAATATPDSARPHVGIVVAAAALCALLAAVVGVHWVNRLREDGDVAVALTGGDPANAAALAIRYGCAGCHTIPGLPGARGLVAAPLEDLRRRVYIAGIAPNTAENLVQWITDPRSLSPGTAMPATGISRGEAADIAAYLYAH